MCSFILMVAQSGFIYLIDCNSLWMFDLPYLMYLQSWFTVLYLRESMCYWIFLKDQVVIFLLQMHKSACYFKLLIDWSPKPHPMLIIYKCMLFPTSVRVARFYFIAVITNKWLLPHPSGRSIHLFLNAVIMWGYILPCIWRPHDVLCIWFLSQD